MAEPVKQIDNDRAMAAATRHLRSSDPKLAHIMKRYGACPLRPRKGYFQHLCRAILGQQLAVKAAETIAQRFLAHFPRRVPTPELVLALSDEAFAQVGVSKQKMGYMRDLAAKFADGTIPVRRLARMTDNEVIEALTQVKGVGVWTAHMFLLFVLVRPDVWPTGDFGIRKAVQRHFDLKEMPTERDMPPFAEAWKPYRSVASWYLWRSLENAPMGKA